MKDDLRGKWRTRDGSIAHVLAPSEISDTWIGYVLVNEQKLLADWDKNANCIGEAKEGWDLMAKFPVETIYPPKRQISPQS